MRPSGPSNYHVVLCPAGPFVVWWDGESRRKRQRLVGPEVFIKGWSLPAKIEGATLGHLLSWIRALRRRDVEILEALCGSRISAFVRELDAAPPADRRGGPVIRIIEIGKAVFVAKSFVRGKREAEVEVRTDCCGLEAITGKRPRRAVRWAIEFLGVPFLKDAVLTIAEKSFVIDSRTQADTVIAPFAPELTLGEVLIALFNEIAFSGTPVERDRFRKELDRRSQDARSGKERTYSWAEVKADLKKELAADPGREKRRQIRERRLWLERHRGDPKPALPAPRIPPPIPWDLSDKPIA